MTAKEWERAAIVYAFTTNNGPGRPEKLSGTGQFPVSVAEFAAIGFHGLRRRETVARYRRVWQQAIDEGYAVEVHPGDLVNLPSEVKPWAEVYDPTEGDSRYPQGDVADDLRLQAAVDQTGAYKVLDIAKNVAAMASAIKGDPDAAEAAIKALREAGLIPEEEDVAGQAPDSIDAELTALAQRVEQAERAAEMARSRSASLAGQLQDAERANDLLEKSGRASKRDLAEARKTLENTRRTARLAEEKYEKFAAELRALRADPERVKQADATQQYLWIMKLLSGARSSLAALDNKLDEEPLALDADQKASALATADSIMIRVTSIKSKLGVEFRI